MDRVLACLAQTHVKVLFSDSQGINTSLCLYFYDLSYYYNVYIYIYSAEGTSNVLASLAQVEAKKNAAIIYPLPLSREKEQVILIIINSFVLTGNLISNFPQTRQTFIIIINLLCIIINYYYY